jgi:hypothetical protein
MRTTKQQKFDKFRAKDNASKYHWERMTKEEREWLIAFEVSEYEAERGHIVEAVDALINVGVIPSDKYVQDMRERRDSAVKSNTQRAESDVIRRRRRQNYQGIRAPKDNMYDSSDYLRVKRGPVDEDDLGVEFAYNKEEVYDLAFGAVKKETSPDNVAVMVNPEDGMIEAIDQARSKSRSLEKLIEDAKLSKEAKANLLALAQKFSYKAMTYTMHGTQYMNLNYILVGADGQLYVQDQHDRIQTLALYLKRHTEDSFATHAEVYYPDGTKEIWIFQPGVRSNIEGKAVKYETV